LGILRLSAIKLQECFLRTQDKFFVRDRRKFDLQGAPQYCRSHLLFFRVRQLLERRNQILCRGSHNTLLLAIENQVTSLIKPMESRASRPLFQPPPKRALAFAGGFAEQKILDADVFVQIGPMKSLSVSFYFSYRLR